MFRWLRSLLHVATVVMVAIAIAALLPFLGHSAPVQGQFGGGIGAFQGTCSGFGIGGIGNFGGCSFGSGFGGGFGGAGGIGGFGGFALATPDSTVKVGESLPLIFGWVVPAPGTWRDIRTLEVRLRDQGRLALWVRWDGSSNTLALVDPATGGTTGPRRHPGSEGQLRGRLASLAVADSAKEDAGPGGDSLALLLPVAFARAAAGRTFLLEIGATHADGELFFATAGRVTVERH